MDERLVRAWPAYERAVFGGDPSLLAEAGRALAGDEEAAAPHLERSLTLARRADDPLTASYALRHLGIAAHRAGDLAEAQSYLEEAAALRRGLQFWPGVAANLVGLVCLAAADHRPADARTFLDEVETLAVASDAHAVLASIHQARTATDGRPLG